MHTQLESVVRQQRATSGCDGLLQVEQERPIHRKTLQFDLIDGSHSSLTQRSFVSTS